ncbi:hypothetical protein [Pedobacter sp. L105]|uniref:hypothetical protein n=1 Tax=Pedobacter sp. L105 TaxID=1641871 RepID=UPI00131C8946|nr:hypothetical protein [Pedobacter sp. L105]
MEDQNSAIRLYQIIKLHTDEQTAMRSLDAIRGTIKGEADNHISVKTRDVKIELEDKINLVKMELIDRINALEIKLTEKINAVEFRLTEKINTVEARLTEKIDAYKVQTIMWIVSMNVIQLVARYFFK